MSCLKNWSAGGAAELGLPHRVFSRGAKGVGGGQRDRGGAKYYRLAALDRVQDLAKARAYCHPRLSPWSKVRQA